MGTWNLRSILEQYGWSEASIAFACDYAEQNFSNACLMSCRMLKEIVDQISIASMH